MRSSTVRGALLLLAATAACSPELRDGVYGCEDGACPDGFSCSQVNQLCYRSEGFASGNGGNGANSGGDTSGGQDSGGQSNGGQRSSGDASGGTDPGGPPGPGGAPPMPVPGAYMPCEEDGDCEVGVCNRGPDDSIASGLCSTECDVPSECPVREDIGGVCADGLCLPGCQSSDDCQNGTSCYFDVYAPMTGAAACLNLESPEFQGTVSCAPMTATACPLPTICIFHPAIDRNAGVCAIRCEPGTDCPADGRCVEVFPATPHCLHECTSDDDCGTDGLVCGTFGVGEPEVCVPSGWVGRTPPLPEPPAPPGMTP